MATDKKNDKETPIKPVDTSKGANPEQSEKKEEQTTDKSKSADTGTKSAQELEALQNGAEVDPVVETSKIEEKKDVDPVLEKTKEVLQSEAVVAPVVEPVKTDAKEALRIADIIEKVFKGKGYFSDELESVEGLVESLFGKSEQEIIELVKPHFIFTEGSTEAKAKELMKTQNVKEIWHCPKTDYWFSREDYAKEHERKNKCIVQHYKQQ